VIRPVAEVEKLSGKVAVILNASCNLKLSCFSLPNKKCN
jgi:hypothetical protein